MDPTDEVKAIRYDILERYIDNYDVVLIAPQIGHLKGSIQDICQKHAIASGLISSEMFGCMDGYKVYSQAKEILQNYKSSNTEERKIAMNALKITLACAGGVSTSILCSRLVDEAKKSGYELDCKAYGANSLTDEIVKGSVVILMGPQVCYMEDEVAEKFPDIPVRLMSMMDYGTMNAKNIFAELKDEFNL